MQSLRTLLLRPPVLAAVIAGAAAIGVGVAAAITGAITAFSQYTATVLAAESARETELKKLETQRASDAEKLQITILLTLVVEENDKRALHTKVMLLSGVLEDRDGKICQGFVQFVHPEEKCPIKP